MDWSILNLIKKNFGTTITFILKEYYLSATVAIGVSVELNIERSVIHEYLSVRPDSFALNDIIRKSKSEALKINQQSLFKIDKEISMLIKAYQSIYAAQAILIDGIIVNGAALKLLASISSTLYEEFREFDYFSEMDHKNFTPENFARGINAISLSKHHFGALRTLENKLMTWAEPESRYLPDDNIAELIRSLIDSHLLYCKNNKKLLPLLVEMKHLELPRNQMPTKLKMDLSVHGEIIDEMILSQKMGVTIQEQISNLHITREHRNNSFNIDNSI